jgi:hypothetical protein
MALNGFLPWSAGVNANVLSQDRYVSRPDRVSGVVSGTASGQQANKTWKQSSVIATMIAQFIVDTLNVDVTDDQSISTIEANFIQAIRDTFNILPTGVNPGLYPQANVTVQADGRITNIASGMNANYANDVGIANAAVAALNPAPISLAAVNGVLIDIRFSASNTGPTTLNLNGTGAVPIVDEAGRALKGGALTAGGIYSVIYNGTNFRLLSRSSVFTDQITVDGSSIAGAQILMRGDGTTTPNKWWRARSGLMELINSAYTAVIATFTDAGALTVGGSVASGGQVSGTSIASTGGNVTSAVNMTAAGAVTGASIASTSGNVTSAANISAAGSIIANSGNLVASVGDVLAGRNIGANNLITCLNLTAADSVAATNNVSAANGNVVAGLGYLRANRSFGDNPGDPLAAVLGKDFTVGSGYIRLPKGGILMWGGTSTPVPIDNQFHVYNLPASFSSVNSYSIIATSGAFTPYPGTMMGAQPANASQFYVTCANAAPPAGPQTLGTWFIAIGT